MYRTVQQRLSARIQAILLEKYDVTLAQLAVEQPPSTAMGELALPVAFELAKRLRKAPRAIATELAGELNAGLARVDGAAGVGGVASLDGVASVEVAGAGYLNIKLDRAAAVRRIAADEHADIGGPGFRLVEHTSINPNKAAHVGHLRNAVLGDTFQRLLRPMVINSLNVNRRSPFSFFASCERSTLSFGNQLVAISNAFSLRPTTTCRHPWYAANLRRWYSG